MPPDNPSQLWLHLDQWFMRYYCDFLSKEAQFVWGGHRGRDRMVVGFTTTCAISAYHHSNCEFKSCWWRGVLDTTLCDKVCQWLATDRWFSLGTPVSSTNKTGCHDITEICWVFFICQ